MPLFPRRDIAEPGGGDRRAHGGGGTTSERCQKAQLARVCCRGPARWQASASGQFVRQRDLNAVEGGVNGETGGPHQSLGALRRCIRHTRRIRLGPGGSCRHHVDHAHPGVTSVELPTPLDELRAGSSTSASVQLVRRDEPKTTKRQAQSVLLVKDPHVLPVPRATAGVREHGCQVFREPLESMV